MKVALALFLGFALAGCGSIGVSNAKDRVRTARASGDRDAVCSAETALAQAYLDAGDSENYRLQAAMARLACMAA
ncbi:hypothetical protein [Sphingomonas immobilis]|uniref:Lipoprotein n=1 Tax=Sphingomonas immobilis TaxID=3063997 RepID=A0ABT9A393_9SPHN|nr:hypothetical protein [Sphingomonas sp. CA1-15]MDO7843456.1 hypothetical protein [Sphingomonas sp. CA1-15]